MSETGQHSSSRSHAVLALVYLHAVYILTRQDVVGYNLLYDFVVQEIHDKEK